MSIEISQCCTHDIIYMYTDLIKQKKMDRGCRTAKIRHLRCCRPTVKNPHLRIFLLHSGWPPSRDPSLHSGWRCLSCWACEASCYDWEILHFVQDDRYQEILHFVQDDRYQEILHFVQDDRHWDDGVRHAELAKHLIVYFRDFSEILHFVQDDHREILHFVQDDRIRHAELAKHLAMIEWFLILFRMTVSVMLSLRSILLCIPEILHFVQDDGVRQAMQL